MKATVLLEKLDTFLTRWSHQYRNLSSLIYPTRSTHTQHLVTGGLWNCQSATCKTDFISGFATQQSLDFLALTETWITPDNTSTPAALSSAFSFTHTPRPTGRGGGTGLLISPKWSFSLYPLPFYPNVFWISCCDSYSSGTINYCCSLPSTRFFGRFLGGIRCPPVKLPRKWPSTYPSGWL